MQVKMLTGLVYGDPQSGKTTLGGSAKRPLILDSDRGAYRALHRPDTLEVHSWQDITDVINDDEIMSQYDTIIIDTVGTALDFLAEHVTKLPGKNSNGSGGLSPQGWGLLKTEFQSLVNKIRVKGKNILFLAHAKEEKDGDVRYYRPDIQGGSKDMVFRICDFIGYAYRPNASTRIVDFSCVEKAMVKDTANIGKITIPDLTEKKPFFEELTKEMLERINNKTEAQKQAAAVVADFRKTVEAIENPEELNAQIAVIATLKENNKSLAMQCYKILEEEATKRHLVFDKESKRYVGKTKPSKTPAEALIDKIHSFNGQTPVGEFNAALAEAREIAKKDKTEGKSIKTLLDATAADLGIGYDSKRKEYFLADFAGAAEEEAEEWV